MVFRAASVLLFFSITFLGAVRSEAASPVWKVTDTKGHTLFLGGSIHALRKSDYPLPKAFDLAFAQSQHLVFEDEETKGEAAKIGKGGEYPAGDSLRNHVDPRTYAYVVKIFGLMGVPEAKVARYRPWMLTLFLWSPGLQGLSGDLGIDAHFLAKARAAHKPISGLVSAREHYAVFTGLTDKQSEGVLLLTFIPNRSGSYPNMVNAWRRGDADVLWREIHASYADYPGFGERLIEARNRVWIPKIESYLASGQTYFVIVGMGHLGGPEGLVRLLQARGYQVEQL